MLSLTYLPHNEHLPKKANRDYRVFIEIEGEEVEVERIFIQMDGGTFWIPNISRVEIHAVKSGENKALVEIITP